MTFTSTDARILYSIYQPKQKTEEVSFRDVISFSDYIDHSIPEYEELSSSLNRLAHAGVVEVASATVKATPAYKKWLTASFKNKKPVSVYKKMQEIEAYLNTSFASLLSTIEEKEIISKEEFEKAVNEYLKRV